MKSRFIAMLLKKIAGSLFCTLGTGKKKSFEFCDGNYKKSFGFCDNHCKKSFEFCELRDIVLVCNVVLLMN